MPLAVMTLKLKFANPIVVLVLHDQSPRADTIFVKQSRPATEPDITAINFASIVPPK
jgi:hypothetical protein